MLSRSLRLFGVLLQSQTDANGSAWGAPLTVGGSYTGEYSSMAIVDGNPAIGYTSGARQEATARLRRSDGGWVVESAGVK